MTQKSEARGQKTSPIGGERQRAWLRSRAKQMRAEMTPQEKATWRLLHDGDLVELNWRRQAAFGDYVLDFVSHAARLVIEIDGAQHGEKVQGEHDAQRSAWLMGQGYRVLRVWNAEAAKEKDGVWRTIHAAAFKTPAATRMQRWRKEHLEKIQAINAGVGAPASPSMGEVASVSEPEGVRRAAGEEDASRGFAGNAGGPHPLSHRASRADSSPIEGERGASAFPIEGERG